MRRLRLVFIFFFLLGAGSALAQRGATLPPSDYGIGNQILSPDAGAVGLSPEAGNGFAQAMRQSPLRKR